MRRHLLIFLMLLLPLQWSWAAAASVCLHEAGQTSHFGHHAHKHVDADQADHGNAKSGGKGVTGHADCGVCQGFGAGVPTPAGTVPAPAPLSSLVPAYAGQLPDPPVERFLRPPLPLVA